MTAELKPCSHPAMWYDSHWGYDSYTNKVIKFYQQGCGTCGKKTNTLHAAKLAQKQWGEMNRGK